MSELPQQVRKFFQEKGSEGGKLGAAKRWSNHEKQSEEEKRKKWNEYQREYRAKRKGK
jgi:hypothetical protein